MSIVGSYEQSIPDTVDSVPVENEIGTHQRDGIHEALRHKKSVGRVAMMERQVALSFCDLDGDIQDGKLQIGQRSLHPLAAGQRKRAFPNARATKLAIKKPLGSRVADGI